MPDPKHNFEKAALALFLCTESDLGQEWRKNPRSVTEQRLKDFGFSPEFSREAPRLLKPMGDEPVQPGHATLAEFTKVAKSLQFHVWSGDPPHPPERRAKEIVEGLIEKGKTSQPDPS
jgi:hypothetical protein